MRTDGIGDDDPEDRGLSERCLIGFSTGPPFQPGGYNNNVQIVQTPGLRRAAARDEPRRADHPDERPSASARQHADLARRLARPLGRRYARCRDHELHAEDGQLQRAARRGRLRDRHRPRTCVSSSASRASTRKTLQYEFTVNDPSTFTRPFTGKVPDELERRADVRVRLPRRELRADRTSCAAAGSPNRRRAGSAIDNPPADPSAGVARARIRVASLLHRYRDASSHVVIVVVQKIAEFVPTSRERSVEAEDPARAVRVLPPTVACVRRVELEQPDPIH